MRASHTKRPGEGLKKSNKLTETSKPSCLSLQAGQAVLGEGLEEICHRALREISRLVEGRRSWYF
jgi:hypothetical protein